MNLIVPECYLLEDPENARLWVEDLRARRFIGEGEDYKLSNFDEEVLLAEMRREYLFEGQMFFIYKRLNHDIIRRSTPKGDVPASNEVFVLPMPESEQEAGNRNVN